MNHSEKKQLSNAPPRSFDFQPEGPLVWDIPVYAHWRRPYPPLPPPCSSTHRAGYGSPLTHKWGAGNTTSENLHGPLANPTFPSAVPEELPAVCHCAKCKYSNDSFQKIPNNKQPNQKKKGGKEKPNWTSSRGMHSRKPKKQADELNNWDVPAMPVGTPLRASKCLSTLQCLENLTFLWVLFQVSKRTSTIKASTFDPRLSIIL